MALVKAMRTAKHLSAAPPERPQMVWSGDGGSVGLGHVYLSRSMVEPLRAGKREEAINIYLKTEKACVLTKLLQSDKASLLDAVPLRGIIEELEDIHCDDPVRGFHVFLMLNDQRRHLSHYYEHIDLHRFEFQLPFYDAVFLEKVLATPVDLCLEHKFYTKWLSSFAPVTKAVPWQAYPGHEPCPLPVPQGLSYQWDPSSGPELQKVIGAQLVRAADEMLGAERFPSQILNKWRLRLQT